MYKNEFNHYRPRIEELIFMIIIDILSIKLCSGLHSDTFVKTPVSKSTKFWLNLFAIKINYD